MAERDDTQLIYRAHNLAHGLGYQVAGLFIEVSDSATFKATLTVSRGHGVAGEGQSLSLALGVLVARLEAQVGTRISELEDLLQ